ncbi:RsmE family RNA methyltransferase [Homoserinibacter gongjuensis]|uniref:Ribosomal RNA small subunit methyltransferase E n=1 Tax=Homoserinibacter gongjuensis TaxID=1162968 RepID=A0ABQ6JXG6_9MICO|nr:hypothetical protein GCM10025869_35250 [Homoserinibacter gongjuensis]
MGEWSHGEPLPERRTRRTGAGGRIEVTGEEARHALQVARVRPGERIAVGDGRGTIVHGVVAEAAPGVLALEVDEVVHEPERRPALWLAQALAKGDRDELAVQAATELGAAGSSPGPPNVR